MVEARAVDGAEFEEREAVGRAGEVEGVDGEGMEVGVGEDFFGGGEDILRDGVGDGGAVFGDVGGTGEDFVVGDDEAPFIEDLLGLGDEADEGGRGVVAADVLGKPGREFFFGDVFAGERFEGVIGADEEVAVDADVVVEFGVVGLQFGEG